MQKKSLPEKIFYVSSVILLASIPISYAYESRFETNLRIEGDFKNTCTSILNILAQEPPDKNWWQTIIKYRWQLKSIVENHPESVWADDAQYIFAVFGIPEGLLIPELEYLLIHFPNAEAEPWTLETLNIIIPEESSLDFSARKELCVNYMNLKKERKLRQLVKSSIEQYPDQAKIFEGFLKPFEKKDPEEAPKDLVSLIKSVSSKVNHHRPSSFPVKAERRSTAKF